MNIRLVIKTTISTIPIKGNPAGINRVAPPEIYREALPGPKEKIK